MANTAAQRPSEKPDAEPADELSILLAWVAKCTDSEVLSCERLATVRPAWKICAKRAGGEVAYVLRGARPAGFGLADIYTLEREADIVNGLGKLPMPVPKVLGMHSAPDAMLLEFMPGSNDFSALDNNSRQKRSIVDHFIDLLAVLHSATPAQLAIDLPLPAQPKAHALGELDIWEKLYRDAAGALDPLLLFALQWLRRNAPDAANTVLVQGDTGPNQCLFSGDRITAVLDWELAHYGDPMEDLGWIAARSFFMDFGRLKQLFARYSELTGTALNVDSIHYYRIMALVKCAIATGLAREGMSAGDDIASIISWDAVNRMALCHCVMEVLQQSCSADRSQPLANDANERSLYRLLGGNFRDYAARADNAFERGRLQGLAQLVDYLALEAAQRGSLIDNDADELRMLCTRCPVDADGKDPLLAVIEADNPQFDIALANYFYRKESRAIALLQQTLGKRVQCLIEPID